MPQPGDPEFLKRNAMLLLRREQEVSLLRQERARAETWLEVFHALSLELRSQDEGALLERWTALLVQRLGFQVAGAYRQGPSDDGHVLQWSTPPARLGGALELDEELAALLAPGTEGRHQAPEATAPMERLAASLGLRKFHWLSLQLDGRSFLLVAGYAEEAAPFHELSHVDHAQFVLLGHHLGALLNSVWLLANLHEERTELRRSNGDLERANARIRVEMEERLALEKKVRHAQKLEALGQLTAGISHELNNPLAYVLANLHFCRDGIEDLGGDASSGAHAELRAAMAEAVDGAERIRRIIRDVTQFARPDEGQLAPVDARDEMEHAIKMCRNEIVHRARLETELHAVPPVVGDARRLQQVFINLLTNAAQAMSERPGGAIRVLVQPDAGGGARVEVDDDGPGIPPEISDRVCDPFFTTRPLGKGTGLGLWVCRSILEGLGGRLEIARGASGGALARVFLRAWGPDDERRRRPDDAACPLDAGSQRRRARILVVDDEALVARAIARLLPEHDARVATTVPEALEAYEAGAYDVVLCDVMMPGATGMDLLAALRARGPGHGERVVLMTGGAFTPGTRELVDAVTNPCLEKPLCPSALRAAITRVLDRGAAGPVRARAPA